MALGASLVLAAKHNAISFKYPRLTELIMAPNCSLMKNSLLHQMRPLLQHPEVLLMSDHLTHCLTAQFMHERKVYMQPIQDNVLPNKKGQIKLKHFQAYVSHTYLLNIQALKRMFN